MPSKVYEASYVCSVLDDCAAVSATERLKKIVARAKGHVRYDDDGNPITTRDVLWEHVYVAADLRRIAIEHRLAGRMNDAVAFERDSEMHLRALPDTAGRSP